MVFTVLALAAGMMMPLNAEETTTLTAKVDSTYTLTIPASTDITYGTAYTDLNGVLKVTGNVEPTQSVKVTSKTNPFKNTQNEAASLSFKLMCGDSEFSSAAWDETQLRNGLAGTGKGQEFQLSVAIDEKVWNHAKTGVYEGTITFTAELKESAIK